MDWLKENWKWIAGGVVLAGATAAGIWYWKKRQGVRTNGLGCACGLGGSEMLELGHGGRTATYQSPSGKRQRGHYRSATGRFHTHGEV